MLPKQHRLDPKRIPLVARKGQRLTREHFLIKFLPQNDADTAKFAIIVSKKVDNRAVIRNRIKRKLRVDILNQVREGKFQPGEYLILVNNVEVLDGGPH